MTTAGRLFDADLPEGFRYEADFLRAADEAATIEQLRQMAFSAFEMRGVVARRRVAFFGATYDRADRPVEPVPDFLVPVRASAAAWAGLPADALAMTLVNEYQPGSPIGWHRDAPQYDIVLGISVLSACRMKFRPYLAPGPRPPERGVRKATHELMLEPRSIYLIAGAARQAYEHSIPPVETLRYSITFRTLRGSGPSSRRRDG